MRERAGGEGRGSEGEPCELVSVCRTDPLPTPSEGLVLFQRTLSNLGAGRADLKRDHHKHTPLFYNKRCLPKTAPKVFFFFLLLPLCVLKNIAGGKSMVFDGERERVTGRDGFNQNLQQQFRYALTQEGKKKKKNLFKSIRRRKAEAGEGDWVMCRPPLLQGALITVIAPPCSLRCFDISSISRRSHLHKSGKSFVPGSREPRRQG